MGLGEVGRNCGAWMGRWLARDEAGDALYRLGVSEERGGLGFGSASSTISFEVRDVRCLPRACQSFPTAPHLCSCPLRLGMTEVSIAVSLRNLPDRIESSAAVCKARLNNDRPCIRFSRHPSAQKRRE